MRRSPRDLSRAERDEFLDLYQRTSAHLSQVRSKTPDPELDGWLTRLLSDASVVLYGTRGSAWTGVRVFLAETFPAAVWHIRRYIATAAALFFVPALILATWTAVSEDVQSTIPPALAEAYIEEDFEAYYSSEPAAEFSTAVFVNNIRVSFLAYAGGILAGIGTALVLVYNGLFLGEVAGLFAAEGELGKFFGLVLPHGLLELTAITVAGGAGFVLGWTLIAPGDRTRGEAIAEEGRRSIVVVIGLIGVFGVAAIIEGFVTGSPLSTVVRVGIGAATWVAFLLYVTVFGRRAAGRGRTGHWGEGRPSWQDEAVEELTSRATVDIGAG